MRIAVIGSWKVDRNEKLRGNIDEFAVACEEIGRELARCGQVVIVGSESPDTADLYVVRGMISVITVMPQCTCRIEVIGASDKREPFVDTARRFPRHILFPPIEGGRWSEAHLMQINGADAVVTIGGAAGTYRAGLAAWVARKTLVPIGSFGGASQRLATTLLSDMGSQKVALAVLSSPWSSHVLDVTADFLGIRRKPRILIIHGRSDDRYRLTEWLRSALEMSDLLIMQQEFGGGRTLPEKFEALAAKADGAIAIATPDDTIVVDGEATIKRARQNVWLEVGWVWGRLGRKKVMLLTRGDLENPSDIQGLEYYSYKSTPVEGSESIRAFLAGLSNAS